MSQLDSFPIYIGKWPDCGCITAACVDDPKHSKDTAKFVQEIVKSGRVVERIAPENWHTVKLQRCPHRKLNQERKICPPKQEEKLLL
jgi:hypothetical protein